MSNRSAARRALSGDRVATPASASPSTARMAGAWPSAAQPAPSTLRPMTPTFRVVVRMCGSGLRNRAVVEVAAGLVRVDSGSLAGVERVDAAHLVVVEGEIEDVDVLRD